jgi:hypothetical protein
LGTTKDIEAVTCDFDSLKMRQEKKSKLVENKVRNPVHFEVP